MNPTLPELYAKYMAAKALTDKELALFHSKLSKLVELLFNMGMSEELMFIKINQALKDAHHMRQSRLTSKKK